jgi:hypothetical protein
MVAQISSMHIGLHLSVSELCTVHGMLSSTSVDFLISMPEVWARTVKHDQEFSDFLAAFANVQVEAMACLCLTRRVINAFLCSSMLSCLMRQLPAQICTETIGQDHQRQTLHLLG